MEIFSDIIGNIFFLTWVGALCGHILSLYANDFLGTKPFLERILPNKSDTFYYRMDFIILPLIGTILAYVLLDPDNVKSSIFSGLSWSGTLVALLQKKIDKIKDDE